MLVDDCPLLSYWCPTVCAGLSPKEHLGKTIAELFPTLCQLVRCDCVQMILLYGMYCVCVFSPSCSVVFWSYRMRNMDVTFVVKVENLKRSPWTVRCSRSEYWCTASEFHSVPFDVYLTCSCHTTAEGAPRSRYTQTMLLLRSHF